MSDTKFKKGNRLAEKPKICPHCGKEVIVRAYAVLSKKIENKSFQNGINNKGVDD